MERKLLENKKLEIDKFKKSEISKNIELDFKDAQLIDIEDKS